MAYHININSLPGFGELFRKGEDCDKKFGDLIFSFWEVELNPFFHVITINDMIYKIDRELLSKHRRAVHNDVITRRRSQGKIFVHPGIVWELSTYLGIKYPSAEIKANLDEQRKKVALLAESTPYCSDVLVSTRALVEEFNTLAMGPFKSRLHELQVRGLWSVLITDLSILELYVKK